MAIPSTPLSSMLSSSRPSPTTSETFATLPTSTSDYDQAYQTAGPMEVSADDEADPNDVNPLLVKGESFIYKYYFLFVILGVVFIIAMLFWGRQRRRKRKEMYSHRGRSALARDVERWQHADPHSQNPQPSSARRWLQRYNRFGSRGAARTGQVEGLNEFGEAPPPYKAQEAALEAAQRTRNSSPPITVPLRILSRSGLGKPPGYDETIHSPSSSDISTRENPASKDNQPSNHSTQQAAATPSLKPESAATQDSVQLSSRTRSSGAA